MDTAAASCELCFHPFTKLKRKPIECPGCWARICAHCITRLDGIPGKCLFCSADWPLDMLEDRMGSALRRAEAERTGARELAILPATAPFVELVDEYASIVKKRIPELLLEREHIKKRAKEIEHELSLSKSLHSYLKDSEKGKELYESQNSATSCSRAAPCPKAACKGFLDAESGRCVACSATYCLTCLEEKKQQPPHVCDRRVLDSLEEIERLTKPCPSCKVPIERGQGCNAMWCVMCDTAFNWSTGKKIEVTDSFHNPHYQASLNRQRDALRDAYAELPYKVAVAGSDPLEANDLVWKVNMFLAATSTELPPRGRRADEGKNAFFRNIDLRVRLMQNLIDEASFKRMAGARAMRQHYPDRAKSLVRELALRACDVLKRLHAARHCHKQLCDESDRAVRELEELRASFNQKLQNAAAAAGHVKPFVVTPHWRVRRQNSAESVDDSE